VLERKVRVGRLTTPLITFALLLIAWEIAASVFHINKVILPAPSDIALAFKANYALLFKETGITLLEALLGFLLGSFVAYLIALAFVHSRIVQDAFFPYAVAIKATPLIAIAPLLVLWFGNGMLSKVVMSALVAFFPVLVNSVKGLSSIDTEVLELMKSLSATRWQVFRKIRFYNSLGYLFSALKTATSLSVVGAVIGEFTGSTSGIGHLISTSSYYFETPLMFAGIMMISMGGILFFWLVSWLENRFVFWESQAEA
jgi:NitT/TauT family transport system permease protein